MKKASTALATAASAKLTNNSIKGSFGNQFWEVGDIRSQIVAIRREAESLSAVLHSFSAVSSTDYLVNFEITLKLTIYTQDSSAPARSVIESASRAGSSCGVGEKQIAHKHPRDIQISWLHRVISLKEA